MKDVCPPGWRVPTKEDWDVLLDYIGLPYAGSKLKKEKSWRDDDEYTNETGFSAFPTGFVDHYEALDTLIYKDLALATHFQSATEVPANANYNYQLALRSGWNGVLLVPDSKKDAASCRCVKN